MPDQEGPKPKAEAPETILLSCFDCARCPTNRHEAEIIAERLLTLWGARSVDACACEFSPCIPAQEIGVGATLLVRPPHGVYASLRIWPYKHTVFVDVLATSDVERAKAAAHQIVGAFKPGRVVPLYIPRCEEVSVNAG